MTLKQILDYTPGKGCKCHAYSEYECACTADWTSRDVLFLEWKLARYSECVRDFVVEYDKGSVSSTTHQSLREFAMLLNEPLRVDFNPNPKFANWLTL